MVTNQLRSDHLPNFSAAQFPAFPFNFSRSFSSSASAKIFTAGVEFLGDRRLGQLGYEDE